MRAAVIAALGVVIGSCAGAPPPACPVAAGSAAGFASPGSPLGFSRVHFWASYRKKTGTGACSTLPGEEIGFQKLETPLKPEDGKVALRPFLLGFIRGNPLASYGAQDRADYDASNDVTDAVFRTDPSDPEGVLLTAIGELPAKPADDGTCAVTGELVNEQTFQEETIALVPPHRVQSSRAQADAGVAFFPELHIKYTWSDLKLVSTSEVPGTVFTAQLEYTEDACAATYDVTGIWPMTLCRTDLDCSPQALPEASDTDLGIPARKLEGSGLNPAFEDAEHPLRCNNSPEVHAYTANYALAGSGWGVCELTKPVSDFTAAP